MAERLAIYTVLPDFEVGGKKGSDSIDWIQSDDPDVNMEQAKIDTMLGNPGPLVGQWRPFPVTYEKVGRRPIPATFYKCDMYIAASFSAKEKLSSISDFEWLALDVQNCPAELVAEKGPSFFIMRFARTVIPHPSSKFEYFPGTKSISDVVSLVLNKKDAEDLYAFRLEGDPGTHYATQNLVELCEREDLKGLEFTPIECEFK
ncbi:MAG TPA: hypothetical protein VMP01_03190 [Pirellulaceae bacterium]|nr:hypothetical protein [Pirellulaceae bacterium]